MGPGPSGRLQGSMGSLVANGGQVLVLRGAESCLLFAALRRQPERLDALGDDSIE